MHTRSPYSLQNLNIGDRCKNINSITELNKQKRRKDENFSSKMKNLRPRLILLVHTRGVKRISDLGSRICMGDFLEEVVASVASKKF